MPANKPYEDEYVIKETLEDGTVRKWAVKRDTFPPQDAMNAIKNNLENENLRLLDPGIPTPIVPKVEADDPEGRVHPMGRVYGTGRKIQEGLTKGVASGGEAMGIDPETSRSIAEGVVPQTGPSWGIAAATFPFMGGSPAMGARIARALGGGTIGGILSDPSPSGAMGGAAHGMLGGLIGETAMHGGRKALDTILGPIIRKNDLSRLGRTLKDIDPSLRPEGFKTGKWEGQMTTTGEQAGRLGRHFPQGEGPSAGKGNTNAMSLASNRMERGVQFLENFLPKGPVPLRFNSPAIQEGFESVGSQFPKTTQNQMGYTLRETLKLMRDIGEMGYQNGAPKGMAEYRRIRGVMRADLVSQMPDRDLGKLMGEILDEYGATAATNRIMSSKGVVENGFSPEAMIDSIRVNMKDLQAHLTPGEIDSLIRTAVRVRKGKYPSMETGQEDVPGTLGKIGFASVAGRQGGNVSPRAAGSLPHLPKYRGQTINPFPPGTIPSLADIGVSNSLFDVGKELGITE